MDNPVQDTSSNGESIHEDRYLVYAENCCIDIEGKVNGRESDGNSYPLEPDKVQDLKRQYVRSFFTDNVFKHVLVLSGAGTSRESGGKTREGLWDSCKEEIGELKKCFDDDVPDFEGKGKDIEGLLSYAIRFSTLKPNHTALAKAILALKGKIRAECVLKAKEGYGTHVEFLQKITARKSSLPRVEVYTLNYDTLFEQAANRAGMIIIDGFSFSLPRTFSGRNFDLDIVCRERMRLKGEENFLPNVFHLIKLHGSVDWYRDGDKVIQCEAGDEESRVMIYPSSEKYEESYEQPFFEAMSRFHAALRREETLLIVLGFGFADRHISNAIVEAVRQNPSFHLMIVDYGKEEGGIHYVNLNQYKEVFKNIGPKISIVQGSFSDFVESLPLNTMYAMNDNDTKIGVRGELNVQ